MVATGFAISMLIISASLNEKMLQPISSHEHSGFDRDETENLFKLKGPFGGDYSLPTH